MSECTCNIALPPRLLRGVTRTVRVTVVDKNDNPVDLTVARNVVVTVALDGAGRSEAYIPGISIQGDDNNVVEFAWYADVQRRCGRYTIDINADFGNRNQSRVDFHREFGVELVEHSCDVSEEPADAMEVDDDLDLEGTLEVTTDGMSAFDQWRTSPESEGYPPTEEGFFAWMRQPATDAAAEVLAELGSRDGSAAGDGTMWGDYKSAEAQRNTDYGTAEGTAASSAGDGTRWGAYKTAEAARSEQLNDLEAEVSQLGQDVSQLLGDVYDTEQDALAGVDTDKQIINSSGVVATADGTNYHVVTFDVSLLQGRTVMVTANTNWGNCLYAIYDGNNNLLLKSSIAPSSGSKYGIIDEEIALPLNAVTLYVAYNISWEQASVKYDKSVSKIEELESIVDVIPTEDKYAEGVENVISGKYISPTGVITNGGETYTISNNVVVSPGQNILITASSNWGNALYAFYASDNTVVQIGPRAASSGTVTEIEDSLVTVPRNAAYVVAARNLNSSNPISVKWEDGKQLTKRFSGKKWVVVGDSLTEHNSRTLKNYHDYVAEFTGIEVVNMGVSGSGYMRLSESNKAFYQRAANIPTDADVVTIFGSGNDLDVSPYDLGEPSDTGTSTICGCINTTLDNILNLFLAANKVPVIGVITPTPWANNEPSTTTGRMPAYCSAIIECCRRKSIPVLDLYHESNLHPDNATFRILAYSRDEGNGVHPDERGHQIIAPMFQNFLQSLLLY